MAARLAEVRGLLGAYARYDTSEMRFIANGVYGNVFQVFDIERKEHVAMKVVEVNAMDTPRVCQVHREVDALFDLVDCEHIIQLYHVFHVNLSADRSVVFMSMKLIETSLRKFIERGTLSVQEIREIMRQVLKAVHHAHKKGYVHCDLKPDNILIETRAGIAAYHVYVADWGLARKIPADGSIPFLCKIVTLGYRAIELLMRPTMYTDRVDTWSIGVILLELFVGKCVLCPNIPDDTEHEAALIKFVFVQLGAPRAEDLRDLPPMPPGVTQNLPLPRGILRMMQTARPTFNMHALDDAANLVRSLLEFSPKRRMSAEKALGAKFFATRTY